jgi:hypothetical protein
MSSEPIDPLSSARAFYAVQLRRLRTEAKMTQSDAGGHPAVMVSGKLIGAVENCYRPPTLRLYQGLDKAFGLVQFFEGMYANIKRESGPTDEFWEYAEYEGLAISIKTYQNFLVPGLLQTEHYARGVLRTGQKEHNLDQLVALRLDRQDVLQRDDPPWLLALLDESVIRRIVSGADVMRGQLEHLLSAMDEPNIQPLVDVAVDRVEPSPMSTANIAQCRASSRSAEPVSVSITQPRNRSSQHSRRSVSIAPCTRLGREPCAILRGTSSCSTIGGVFTRRTGTSLRMRSASST